MSLSESTNTEIEGSVVYLIHVDDSGTDPVRTALALTAEDELSLSIDEDNEDFNAAGERRTRRYRTNNTVDLSAGAIIDTDLEALDLVGIVDSSDGSLTFGTGNRRIRPADDEYMEIGYATLDDSVSFTDFDLVHRFHDVELVSPEVDISSTPPMLSWTWWIHGDIIFDYTSA